MEGRGRGPRGLRRTLAAFILVVACAGQAPTQASAAQVNEYALPPDVSPAVSKARANRERLWADRCIALAPATVPRNCVYGNPNGSFTLAIVGDSHISHFFPAFERLAVERGWRLVVMVKISCPLVDIRTRYLPERREYPECATWNRNVIARLTKSPPDLTVVGYLHQIHVVRKADRTVAAKAASAARMLHKLPGKRLLLADSLLSSVDVPVCLAKNMSDIRQCSTPRWRAYRNHGLIERRAATRAGVPLIDLAPRICNTDPCPAVVNKMIVYRDTHHLTATFARSLWPDLMALIDKHH